MTLWKETALNRRKLKLVMLLAAALFLAAPSGAGWNSGQTAEESISYFKLLSSVEYSGKTQYCSQAETFFTVHRRELGQNKVEYVIKGDNTPLITDEAEGQKASEAIELSFVVDRSTGQLTGSSRDMQLLQAVNNRSAEQLNQVMPEQMEKSWQQSLDLSFLGDWIGPELKFTMTTLNLETEAFGPLLVVRALSKPFAVNIIASDGQARTLEARINAAYLFDTAIENIYMSMATFEVSTKAWGNKEKLRYEIATYRTDAEGTAADLAGLGKKFGKFVRKVGLTRKVIKVKNEGPIAQWAKSEGLRAAQIANVCAAIACEDSVNPVATVFIPAAQTIQMQSIGALMTAGQIGAVSTLLTTGVPAIGTMKIAAAPAIMGMSMGTAAAVAGGTVGGTVAVAGGGSSGSSSSQSPTSP